VSKNAAPVALSNPIMHRASGNQGPQRVRMEARRRAAEATRRQMAAPTVALTEWPSHGCFHAYIVLSGPVSLQDAVGYCKMQTVF
jgi:hypothetical protein